MYIFIYVFEIQYNSLTIVAHLVHSKTLQTFGSRLDNYIYH